MWSLEKLSSIKLTSKTSPQKISSFICHQENFFWKISHSLQVLKVPPQKLSAPRFSLEFWRNSSKQKLNRTSRKKHSCKKYWVLYYLLFHSFCNLSVRIVAAGIRSLSYFVFVRKKISSIRPTWYFNGRCLWKKPG